MEIEKTPIPAQRTLVGQRRRGLDVLPGVLPERVCVGPRQADHDAGFFDVLEGPALGCQLVLLAADVHRLVRQGVERVGHLDHRLDVARSLVAVRHQIQLRADVRLELGLVVRDEGEIPVVWVLHHLHQRYAVGRAEVWLDVLPVVFDPASNLRVAYLAELGRDSAVERVDTAELARSGDNRQVAIQLGDDRRGRAFRSGAVLQLWHAGRTVGIADLVVGVARWRPPAFGASGANGYGQDGQ